MYSKGKGTTVPSDSQAREKLALYVYEYLLHVGAQKAAQTFLSEIRWEKISLLVNRLDFCILGGVYFGTYIQQHQNEGIPVNTAMKPKLFMIMVCE